MSEHKSHEWKLRREHREKDLCSMDSQVIVPHSQESVCKELEDLSPYLEAIQTPPEKIKTEQLENARAKLMKTIEESESNFMTTLKDSLTATDSILIKVVIYGVIILALAAMAAGAFFLFNHLTASPASAAAAASLDLFRTLIG